MSDAEGLMWRLEKDPFLSATFANVTIVDTPIDVDRFRRRMERASIAVPRLRQRVQPSIGNLTPPDWVDDIEFSISRHVRHVALPAPGSLRQLLDLASQVATTPFDRSRPLWEFIAVDGLRGGKGALVQKMHHTIADGEGSIRLSMQFLDLTRDAPEPEPLAYVPAHTPTPAPLDVMQSMLADVVRRPLEGLRQLAGVLADPVRLPSVAHDVVATVRSAASQLNDNEPARSPLWSERSLGRRVEIIRTPLEPMKKAAKRRGGTINTALLTVAADASGAYHREMGQPIDALRASMAISTRTRDSGSNAFSLVRFLVPTGEMSIDDRFARIAAATDAARVIAGGATLNRMASLTTSIPTMLLTRMARSQAESTDFATSNVRAASFPVFIAGAEVLQNHPIGPLAGVAFNLTLMSYNGSLDMGLNIDTAAIAQPELLRKLLVASLRGFTRLR